MAQPKYENATPNVLRLLELQADTPVGWITFGVHEDLGEAMWLALDGMLDALERRGYKRKEALMLASLTVDLRITQIVNGTKGVPAILPHDVLNDCPPGHKRFIKSGIFN